MKSMLVGEYFTFHVFSDDQITREVFAEKACDYFEKVEIKTDKSFDKCINKYMDNINSIVEPRIAKPKKDKKNDLPPVCPRARKYYDKAMSYKNARAHSEKSLIEFSRIMMCLYSSVIDNGLEEIDNLDYSLDSIKPELIIQAMKEEKPDFPIVGKKTKFNIKDLYCEDTCTFIITIVMLYTIIDGKVQEEE